MATVHLIRWSILLMSIVFSCCEAKSLPAGFLRCSRKDPAFGDCFSKALLEDTLKFKNGYPSLGIVKLEPFFIKTLDLGKSSTGSVNFHQVYENVNLYGLTKSHAPHNMTANFNGDNCYWRFNVTTPVLRMESDYTIKGQVLIFPINGHGTCTNTLYDLNVRHEMKCERYKKKGNKTHYRVTEYTLAMDPKSVVFDFKNIIEGNEQLSAEILKTINENALTVYGDVKGSFGEAFSQIYTNIGNNFFGKVPEDELFLD